MQKIYVTPSKSKGSINKNIYGHFSEHLGRCIYQGYFVGKDSPIPNVNGIRKDVVEALRKIRIPVLRWPGGCFADEYHWEDGVGENRKRMVNTHWGSVVEDNSFGTHEFFDLCEQLGCEPYVNANVGSGTVREMSEWVEYINSDGDSTVVQKRWANGRKDAWTVKYWGVGNENWGCGGQMRPEYYADEYRRFQTYCRNYNGKALYRIACGPNIDDYNWMEVLMQRAGYFMDAITLHYYTVPGPWSHKGSATEFTASDYYKTLRLASRMEELVTKHTAIMDKYDPKGRVGLIVDEWGAWYDVEPGTNPGFLYQQNTMRDALVAAITLNIFNRHCDRIVMANLAQTINVLQAVILTEGDKIVLTPTYHVFDLYKAHQGARELECYVSCDDVTFTETNHKGETSEHSLPVVTASSSEKDGVITTTLANISADQATDVLLTIHDVKAAEVKVRILTGAIDQYNDFDNALLAVQDFTDYEVTDAGVVLHLPPCCVAEVSVRA